MGRRQLSATKLPSRHNHVRCQRTQGIPVNVAESMDMLLLRNAENMAPRGAYSQGSHQGSNWPRNNDPEWRWATKIASTGTDVLARCPSDYRLGI